MCVGTNNNNSDSKKLMYVDISFLAKALLLPMKLFHNDIDLRKNVIILFYIRDIFIWTSTIIQAKNVATLVRRRYQIAFPSICLHK